jgi:hypothetical protein
MAEPTHTPGPWCWRISRRSHGVELKTVGRGGIYVMGFARWGTSSAQPTFNVGHMVKAVDLAVDIPGQEHNNTWNQTFDHPDARLIAAAPELLAALEAAREALEEMACEDCGCEGSNPVCRVLDDVNAAIEKATGGAP